jgi:MFS family permease
VFSLSYVISTLLMGVASDRFGNRLPLAGLAGVVAAGTVLLGSATALPVFVVAAALVGFGGGLWTLLPAAVALEFGAANVGRAFGMLLLFLPINASVPSIISKVQESTGSYALSLLALGAACLVGGLLVLLMRERRGGHPTAEEKIAAMQEPVTPIP